MIEFCVPGVPVAQPRHNAGVSPGGKAVVYLDRSHPVHAYKQAVQLAARAALSGREWDLSGPMFVRAVFLFSRPGRVPKSPQPRYRHTARPDGDNLMKSIMDALNLICWTDDAQVAHHEAEKWVAASGEEPATFVYLRRLD